MTIDLNNPEEGRLRGTIRKVLRGETYLIEEHLLRLSEDARRRRFGHDVSDRFISDYALHAADVGNFTFAYFCEGDIRAVAELRHAGSGFGSTGEVALSVENAFSGRGVGTRLMAPIITAARNRGIRQLLMVCLADNAKMQSIARHYGADLHVEDGSVTADLIPRRSDYASWASEYFENRFVFVQAAIDLHSRVQRRSLSRNSD